MNIQTRQKHMGDDKSSEVIDKVLRQIFGHEATLIIYKYLETHHSLRQHEIGEKIDVFAEGLEELLRSGAYVIETKILEEIHSDYGSIRRLEFERSKYDFVSQMRTLMQKA